MTTLTIRLQLTVEGGDEAAFELIDDALDAGTVQEAIAKSARAKKCQIAVTSAYVTLETPPTLSAVEGLDDACERISKLIRQTIRPHPLPGARASLRLAIVELTKLRGRLAL